ncbi:MAG: exodeoxyribonuclease VII large subunit [Planctomycetota bacterium]
MTGRLPFDPGRARGKRVESSSEDDTAVTVSALATMIGDAIERGLPSRVRVRGEVSNLSRKTHAYFSLKDGEAVVGAAMWASSFKRGGARAAEALQDGAEVVAMGRVDYYRPNGRVSLIVETIERVGSGALEARLRALVDELRALGWLDEGVKRPLPLLPRKIAVVTSASGAAIEDVIDTAARRCAGVGVVVVDVRVQGEGAASEVASAIGELDRRRDGLGIDALLVTRGGGSIEDLWAFNEREVAEAIHACSLPVVAAIGHETDTTVAELVADVRAATPTQAAVRLVPDREDLLRQVGSVERALASAVRRAVDLNRGGLERLASRGVLADPRRVIAVQRERLAPRAVRLERAGAGLLASASRRLGALEVRLERVRPAAVHARRSERLTQVASRLRRVMARSVERRRRGLESVSRELEAIGPMAVLSRGYNVTRAADGSVVRSAGSVGAGDRVETRTADGSFGSVVEGPAGREGKKREEPSPRPLPEGEGGGGRRGNAKGRRPAKDAGGLFDG